MPVTIYRDSLNIIFQTAFSRRASRTAAKTTIQRHDRLVKNAHTFNAASAEPGFHVDIQCSADSIVQCRIAVDYVIDSSRKWPQAGIGQLVASAFNPNDKRREYILARDQHTPGIDKFLRCGLMYRQRLSRTRNDTHGNSENNAPSSSYAT